MYCGYSVGGVLASLVGIFVVPGTSWRVLYLLGVIPLLALPFFFRQFPESLSFYILQKQTKKLAKILNSVHPHGRYSESDDYQFFSMKETTKRVSCQKTV